jgi:hypothetical protein
MMVGSSLCLAIQARAADAAWTLVTPEEALQDRSRPHRPELRAIAVSKGPRIEMAKPDVTKPVRYPINLRIQFVAQPGTSLDLGTFKATYGFFDLDITKRILGHAMLSTAGLAADNAEIPPGDHRVTLSIADNLGQVGSRAFSFTVAA